MTDAWAQTRKRSTCRITALYYGIAVFRFTCLVNLDMFAKQALNSSNMRRRHLGLFLWGGEGHSLGQDAIVRRIHRPQNVRRPYYVGYRFSPPVLFILHFALALSLVALSSSK